MGRSTGENNMTAARIKCNSGKSRESLPAILSGVQPSWIQMVFHLGFDPGVSLTSDYFTPLINKRFVHPHDENAKFYRAQLVYKILSELHTRRSGGYPPFLGFKSHFCSF
jgi:hypothetical protein